MKQVNIQEAENGLSRLIGMLETRQEDQVVIARGGLPVVKMTLYAHPSIPKRIGVAKGKIVCPDNLDEFNDEIADMFEAL